MVGREVQRVVPDSFCEIVRTAGTIPVRLADCKLPRPPNGLPLEAMQLRVRTRNALRKAGFDRDPRRIGDLTVGELRRLRGMGPLSICDLVESLERLVRTTCQLAARTRRSDFDECAALLELISECATVPACVRSAHVPPPRGTSIDTLQLQSHTRTILQRHRLGSDLSRLSRMTIGQLLAWPGFGRSCLVDLLQAIWRSRRRRASAAATDRSRRTVEEELVNIVLGKRSKPRDREIVTSYYGLSGQVPGTLRRVGSEFQMTGERVRQICAPSHLRRSRTLPFAPALDWAISLIQERVPASPSEIQAELVERGLLKPATSLRRFRKIAETLGRGDLFQIRGKGASRYVIMSDQRDFVGAITTAASRLVSRSGAASVDRVLTLAKTKGIGSDAARQIAVAVIRSMAGFCWLDESQGWFWLQRGGQDPLSRRIRRVLAVCGEIEVSELEAALRRDPTPDGLPPTHALLELCRHLPGLEVEQTRVRSKRQQDLSIVLKGDEAIVVGLLRQHGPLCRTQDLRSLAAQAGVGLASLRRCLFCSPTVKRYAHDVYGLVGAADPK